LSIKVLIFIKFSDYFKSFLVAINLIRQLALWKFSEMWTESQPCKTETWPYRSSMYENCIIS